MHTSIRLVAFVWVLGATAIEAQDAKSVDGVWSMAGKPYKLVHVVAHETSFQDRFCKHGAGGVTELVRVSR